jgi:hypothetical protein
MYTKPVFSFRYPVCPACKHIIRDQESVVIWCHPGHQDNEGAKPFIFDEMPYHYACAAEQVSGLTERNGE